MLRFCYPLCLALFLAAGCDRPGVPSSLSALKGNPRATYQGRTAADWNRQLQDADWNTSQQAAFALDSMNDDGIYYLVLGMASASEQVRFHCNNVVKGDLLKRHEAAARPFLEKLLTDPSAQIRDQAQANLKSLGWLPKKNG